MADIVDLTGAKMIAQEQSLDDRALTIREALAEIGAENDQREIRSVIIAVVDRKNRVHTTLVRDNDDEVMLLGAIEIMKSDILHSARERRVFTPIDDEG